MNRLRDVATRIENIHQIDQVVIAMRGLSAAHARDARNHLDAIRAYETTIGNAISDALALAPPSVRARPASDDTRQRLTLVIGAEQGFSGAYTQRIMAAALAENAGSAVSEQVFIVIGQRSIAEFSARHGAPLWSAHMVNQAREVPNLASRIVDAVFAHIQRGEISEVCIIFAHPKDAGFSVTRNRIVPFDFSRFPQPAHPPGRLLQIPPRELIEQLVEEYVFSEICEALMLGFAAENNARLAAMTRARTNVDRINQDLKHELNQVRQEQTTSEVIELSRASR